jgi:hypothetical protein
MLNRFLIHLFNKSTILVFIQSAHILIFPLVISYVPEQVEFKPEKASKEMRASVIGTILMRYYLFMF